MGGKEKDKLTPLQIAAIKGYCKTRNESNIPPVWSKLEVMSDITEARKTIVKAFEAARVDMGIEIAEMTNSHLIDATLIVIRVNGSYKNKIIRKFFLYQFLRKIPVAISYNSHLRFAIMMINLCGALMFNYMVAEMPTLDQKSQ